MKCGATVDDYFSFGERRGRASRLPHLIKQPSGKPVAAIFPSGGDAVWPRQATRRLDSRAPARTVIINNGIKTLLATLSGRSCKFFLSQISPKQTQTHGQIEITNTGFARSVLLNFRRLYRDGYHRDDRNLRCWKEFLPQLDIPSDTVLRSCHISLRFLVPDLHHRKVSDL